MVASITGQNSSKMKSQNKKKRKKKKSNDKQINIVKQKEEEPKSEKKVQKENPKIAFSKVALKQVEHHMKPTMRIYYQNKLQQDKL